MDASLDDRVKEINWALLKHRKHQETLGVGPEVEILRQEVDSLKATVAELQASSKSKPKPPSVGEDIYNLHKSKLEKEHRGQVVAIDISSKKIVGFGSDIDEAYDDARKNAPQQDQFYFRRVGKPYVQRL